MDKESAIRVYLHDVKLGYGFVTLEKIEFDCQEDGQLILAAVTLNNIIKYALDNGWKIYDDPSEGWSITSN